MDRARTILHVDMDAFFASVEQRDDPTLRGKPVVVGGTGSRGVIAAASYEARRFGCHSAQPTAVARRLCPDLIVVKPRGRAYREASDAVFEILHDVTPLVQPLSIDEAFLDVTGSLRAMGDGETIARGIKADVLERTGLNASVGVAPNKFLAKLASDLEKPDGLVIIRPDRVDETLIPLPVSTIFGIGPKSVERFKQMGVRTIGDLRAFSADGLESRFGSSGRRYWNLARGLDDRPVVSDRDAKSISHERTFGVNLADPDAVRRVILDQSEQVARRVRRRGVVARTATVKIRYGDFETITRSGPLRQPSDETDTLYESARGLFDAWVKREGFRPVRLIGVQATQFEDEVQMGLFDTETRAKRTQVDEATDAIVAKFGRHAITRAGAIEPPDRPDDKGAPH